MGEFLSHQIYKVLMIQASCSRNDHVARIKETSVVVEQHLLLELSNSFFRPENWLPQRMIFPEVLRENLVDKVVRTVLVHFDFFKDHAALAEYVLAGKNWVQHQVG